MKNQRKSSPKRSTTSVATRTRPLARSSPAHRPSPRASPRSSPTPMDPVFQGDTIAQIATKDGRFSTLLSLVQNAGLADLLNDRKKTFTVFAPTNTAFAKLPKKTLDLLTSAQGVKKLKEILLYHVLPERFESSDIEGVNTKRTSLKDNIVCIYVYDGKAHVNDAQIIQADIRTANGVIHVIDTVLADPKTTCGKYY